jgi:hypothetical protein
MRNSYYYQKNNLSRTTKMDKDYEDLRKVLLKLSVPKVERLVQSPRFASTINIRNENELHLLFDPQINDCAKYFKCGMKEKCPQRHHRINRIVILLVEAGVDPGLRRHSDNCTPIQMAVRRPYIASYTVLKMLSSSFSSLGFSKDFRSVR